jgi:3-hydroxybutyryl-CoA dehydrogenase
MTVPNKLFQKMIKRGFSCTSRALTPLENISRVGVIGSGQMGVGIALVAANIAKLPVTLVDARSDALKKGLKFMGG